MRLLVTRPQPEAKDLADMLTALGHSPIVEPLMQVDYSRIDVVDLTEAQALVATSRNGLRGLAHQGAEHIGAELPIYAVGPGTAKAAREMGFKVVVAGAGTAEQIVPQIVTTLDPQYGVLIHLAGDRLAFDLARALESYGFRLLQPIVYRMAERRRLTALTITALYEGALDGVLLLSPRTADIFVKLVTAAQLVESARQPAYICLSQAIADRLQPLGPIKIAVAEQPTLVALLELVGGKA